MAAPFE